MRAFAFALVACPGWCTGLAAERGAWPWVVCGGGLQRPRTNRLIYGGDLVGDLDVRLVRARCALDVGLHVGSPRTGNKCTKEEVSYLLRT